MKTLTGRLVELRNLCIKVAVEIDETPITDKRAESLQKIDTTTSIITSAIEDAVSIGELVIDP